MKHQFDFGSCPAWQHSRQFRYRPLFEMFFFIKTSVRLNSRSQLVYALLSLLEDLKKTGRSLRSKIPFSDMQWVLGEYFGRNFVSILLCWLNKCMELTEIYCWLHANFYIHAIICGLFDDVMILYTKFTGFYQISEHRHNKTKYFAFLLKMDKPIPMMYKYDPIRSYIWIRKVLGFLIRIWDYCLP